MCTSQDRLLEVAGSARGVRVLLRGNAFIRGYSLLGEGVFLYEFDEIRVIGVAEEKGVCEGGEADEGSAVGSGDGAGALHGGMRGRRRRRADRSAPSCSCGVCR